MVSKRPLVSVGLPVYNGEKYLKEALDAILSQSFTDFEVVISDNGSEDGTRQICESVARREARIRYVYNKSNRGAAWNYNRVFSISSGKYFKWAAHDDLMLPSYLERCIQVLESDSSVVLCYPKASIINESGAVILEEVHDDFERLQSKAHERIRGFRSGPCYPVFGVIRRGALEKTDLIGAYPGSDRILWWQLLLVGKFARVSEPLFLKRSHPEESSRANPDYKSRMKWFDPKKSSWWYLPTWYHVFKRAEAIHRACLSGSEKRNCYLELGKQRLLHPRWMITDFIVAFREALGVSPLMKKDFHSLPGLESERKVR